MSTRPAGILILENELNMGGIEKKLLDFIPRLDPQRFRVAVCCLKPGGYFRNAFIELGVPLYDNVMRGKYDILAYRELARILRREKIDIIYTLAHPNAIIFSDMARRTGAVKLTVLSIHASGSYDGGRVFPRYLKPFLGSIDRYIAVAHMHKRYLVEQEGLDASRITVIHNGVDAARYHPGKSDAELRASLGLGASDHVITVVAQLNPRKNIDKLLRSVVPLLSEHPDLRVLVVGDGQERDNLTRLARDLGLSERVIFAGLRPDVDHVLRESDVFVLPSRPGSETFPNVVLEAMASGLPVVATRVGSVPELVVEGKTGSIVPHDDVEALTRAISSLLADPGKMAAWGAEGRRVVESSFDLEQMYCKREALFDELLGE